MEQFFTLTAENVEHLGLDPVPTWFGIRLLEEETGDRRCMLTTDETAYIGMVNTVESGVAPPAEFADWLSSAFEIRAGWPETW